jgi:hypothetical protein
VLKYAYQLLRKELVMQYIIFGAVIAICGLLWAILELQNDPLEQAIEEANAWDSQQKRLRQVLGK